MAQIKIKWITEEKDNAELGRVITGSEYTVTSTLGEQLISQGFAVEVKKKETPKAEKLKGGIEK